MSSRESLITVRYVAKDLSRSMRMTPSMTVLQAVTRAVTKCEPPDRDSAVPVHDQYALYLPSKARPPLSSCHSAISDNPWRSASRTCHPCLNPAFHSFCGLFGGKILPQIHRLFSSSFLSPLFSPFPFLVDLLFFKNTINQSGRPRGWTIQKP